MTDDITNQLLDEAELTKKEDEVRSKAKAIAEKEDELKASKKVQQKDEKRMVRPESIASETPQDRFRRIVRDQGYSTGVNNMSSVFFEGNTDSPQWLDEVLKLSHLPARNREIIITAYYGRTPKELGISVESGFSTTKKEDEKKIEEAKKAAADDGEIDLIKLSQDELKETIRNEKTLLAIAQMRDMRERLSEGSKKQEPPQQQYQMRQIIKPMIREGKLIYNKDGTIMTETIVEPVTLGQQQGGANSDILTALAMRGLTPPEASKQSTSDPALLEYIKKLDSKIEGMEASRQIQAKEEEIKRMNDKMERKEEEYKKDMERKEKENSDRLDKMNAERIRDLTELKERFAETIQHKKELDDVIGQISGSHKKEIDGLKQKLEHTQTNIERTIVSKGTETVDKMTGKIGDIAEDVIKPLASVMSDHYKTVIDQTRINAGLPTLRDTIPKINESELERFARGE